MRPLRAQDLYFGSAAVASGDVRTDPEPRCLAAAAASAVRPHGVCVGGLLDELVAAVLAGAALEDVRTRGRRAGGRCLRLMVVLAVCSRNSR